MSQEVRGDKSCIFMFSVGFPAWPCVLVLVCSVIIIITVQLEMFILLPVWWIKICSSIHCSLHYMKVCLTLLFFLNLRVEVISFNTNLNAFIMFVITKVFCLSKNSYHCSVGLEASIAFFKLLNWMHSVEYELYWQIFA